jgi:hypothetical protein
MQVPVELGPVIKSINWDLHVITKMWFQVSHHEGASPTFIQSLRSSASKEVYHPKDAGNLVIEALGFSEYRACRA